MMLISYDEDLENAGSAWDMGNAVDVTSVRAILARSKLKTGLVTGIGCSSGVAMLLSDLIQRIYGTYCTFQSPADLHKICLRLDVGVLVTGQGSHSDSIACYRQLTRICKTIIVISASSSTRLQSNLEPVASNTLFLAPHKSFIRKNAFAPVGTTAYCAAIACRLVLGEADSKLSGLWKSTRNDLVKTKISKQVLAAESLHILSTKNSGAACADLCNRLKELGAFSPVIHDMISFAHGGYMALSRFRHLSSGLLVFKDRDCEAEIEWLSHRLPSWIRPTVLVIDQKDKYASISAYICQMCLIPRLCGRRFEVLKVPHIPDWGNSVYQKLGGIAEI